MAFDKRRILGNGTAVAGQIIVTTLGYFVLYRVMVGQLGTAQLGLWAIASVVTPISQVGNLGVQGAVVRLVADAAGRSEKERASRVLGTALVGLSLILAVVFCLVGSAFGWALKFILADAASLAVARDLLPLILIAGYMGGVAGVLLGVFDGLQMMQWTSGMKILSMVLFVGSAIGLLRFGLRGVAVAAIVQQSSLLVMAAVTVRRQIPLTLGWNRQLFGEIARYGMGLQTISLLTLVFDPLTKGLLARFGGLESTGIYEIAARIVTQSRALLSGGVSALVPAVATLGGGSRGDIRLLYHEALGGCLFIGIPLFTAVGALTPLLSRVMTGSVQSQLIVFTWILGAGWLVNTASLPAYMIFAGIGRLRWNIVGQASIAFANVGLGVALGVYYGATGVVFGWALALSLGCLIPFVASLREGLGIVTAPLIREAAWLFGRCFVSALLVLSADLAMGQTPLGVRAVLIGALTLASTLWACSRHPLAARLANRGRVELANIRERAGS